MHQKSSQVTQRWYDRTADAGYDSGETPAGLVTGKDKGVPLISWRRIGAECLIVVLVLGWITTLCFLFSSRFSQCYTTSTQRSFGRYINVHSYNTMLHWSVDAAGVVVLSPTKPSNATFYVEWREGKWFCLRSVRDLRVLEVVSPPEAPLVMRTGRYACNESKQWFSYRGRGLWSMGINAYVHIHDGQPPRLQGDSPTWKPLRREPRVARLVVESLPGSLDEALALEDRLLQIISKLEAAARPELLAPAALPARRELRALATGPNISSATAP